MRDEITTAWMMAWIALLIVSTIAGIAFSCAGAIVLIVHAFR